jgi:cell division protein FtsZ
VPLSRPAPSVLANAREEVASLVPSKGGPPRPLTSMEGGKSVSTRTAVVKDAALPLDEDQFDIPTFLRRQGQTELP